MPLEQSELKIKTVKTERLAPDPKGTAQALQRIGYSLDEALADLVDNSIDAEAKKIIIRFFRTANSITQVAIVDDGRGMDETTLHRAMQYGVQMQHSASDLGKYGIGLKTASFSQCQSVSVLSKQNGRVHGRRWTLSRMQDDWRCEFLDPVDCARLFDLKWGDLSLRQHGTMVIWNDLDALSAAETNEIDKLIRKITKRLPAELGLHFHRFIESGAIVLKCDVYNLDGGDIAPITVPAVNPFAYGKSGCAGYPVTFKVEVPNRGSMKMIAHIWPPKSEKFEYKLGRGKVAERQGFYFYRNDRLIQGGGWNGVRESESEPHASLARVQVDLPPELDSTFGLTIQKSKVVPPPNFKSLVTAAKAGNTTFEDYVSTAIGAYRDNEVEDSEAIVPGAGLPAALQRKLADMIASDGDDAREIRFEWKELPHNQFFDVDGPDDVVYINLEYRPLLVEKGMHFASDAPLVKSLLFLLLLPDLKKERSSKKREEWHDLCNKVLVAAARATR